MTRWNTGRPPSEIQIKTVYPNDRRHHQATQDQYAGGWKNRQVQCHDGSYRTGAIRLRMPREQARRAYAELIWAKSDPDRAGSILVCEADQPTRDANLAKAWQIVHDHALTTIAGRHSWKHTTDRPRR